MTKTSAPLIKTASLVFWSGLVVYALTLPIPHTIAVRYAAFVLLILATLGLCIGERQLPALPVKWAWIIYATIALFSCIYAVSPVNSLSEVRVEIGYSIVLFSIAVTWARHHDILRVFVWIAVLANLLLVVVALATAGLGKTFGAILGLPGWARAGLNANYLLTMAPLLAYHAGLLWVEQKRRLAAVIVLVLMLDVVSMIVGYNRQATLALATGIICAGLLMARKCFTWKRAAAFSAIMLVLTGLILVQMARRADPAENVEQVAHSAVTQDVRWPLWRFSVQKIAEHPLAGGGFGRAVFDKLYPDFMPNDPMLWHAHNMVLNKGIQMGVPGMLAFLLLWYALLRIYARRLGHPVPGRDLAVVGIATLATVFMKNMTDDFFVRDMALWFWLVNGILIGSLQRRDTVSPPVMLRQ